ncbi:sterol desaturase family protein [Rhodopirellula sallentina]|uniref:Fatty acid hydroxylase n=1 Tax=Rhodopirellula sallentina SM41 TaxID=1263870 RepID=M5U3I9_9BACT|nr:sterol desaturase family protein [Rhodopirellula sallentina]EMI55824.1 fatty acid hydroxylase [Rhodopirellula sallentina SM41]
MDDLILRLAPASLWLAILWCVETFVGAPAPNRFRHGFVNLSLAAINGVLLFFTFGALSIWVCTVSPVVTESPFVFLHSVACFFALDLFSYCWHRLNHSVPALWRIHSVHHSDAQMDVTTAGRFHALEIAIGALLRLPVLYALGVSTITLVAYETTLVLVSMFHHSKLNLGVYDWHFRLITASPLMHSIHHSCDPRDYGSNFSSVLSLWDRVFSTLRLTERPLKHGLEGSCPESLGSLVARPFVADPNSADNHPMHRSGGG